MSQGSLFKRCGCTEIIAGKRRQLGSKCPKLRRSDGTWNPRHGTWTYATEGPGKGGKRKPIVRGGFETAKEAQQALDETRARIKHGTVVNDRLTVGRYLDEWLAAKGDIRPSTLRSYAQHINKYLRPGLGHLRLAEVRIAHVAECLAEVTSSDANRQRVRATLRAAFNDAIREGLILINPAALVKLASGARPKGLVWTPARVRRWEEAVERLAATAANDPARAQLETAAQPPSAVMVWTPAQLGTFLDAAEHDPLYALFHLIAHRGLRRGESCGLAWTDVDLDAGRLAVRQQIVQLGWDTYEDAPKSDAGDREVALDAGTVAALRAHRRQQIASRLQWGPAWVDSGKVFTREDGSVLHPATVTDRFQALAAAAKLPPIRLARSPARRRIPDAGRRGGPEGRPGDPRALVDHPHPRHLHERLRRGGGRGRGGCGGARSARGHSCTHTAYTPGVEHPRRTRKLLVSRWGGWGSNPRPDGL